MVFFALIVLIGLAGLVYLIGYFSPSRRYYFFREPESYHETNSLNLTVTRYFLNRIPTHKKTFKGLNSVNVTVKTETDTPSGRLLETKIQTITIHSQALNPPVAANPDQRIVSLKISEAQLATGESIDLARMPVIEDIPPNVTAHQAIQLFTGESTQPITVRSNSIFGFIVNIVEIIIGYQVLKVLFIVLFFLFALIFGDNDNEPPLSDNDNTTNPNPEVQEDIERPDPEASEPSNSDSSESSASQGMDGWKVITDNSSTTTNVDNTANTDSVEDTHTSELLPILEKTVADLPDYIPKIDKVDYGEIYLNSNESHWNIYLTGRGYEDDELAQALKAGFAAKGWETSKVYELPITDLNDASSQGSIAYNFEFRTFDKSVTGGMVTTMPKGGEWEAILFVPEKE